MPRALAKSVSEKAALQALNGGSLEDVIRVRGARQHNLKNVDVTIPRNKLVVFTGVSGSGKSSLAFDTIFAEGQRRYVESLSAYARQFLGQVDKPDVDAIEGLSPAISIDQKSTSHNPRSTVGTVTEIQDYLRLLFGRAGEPHCPECDRSIRPQSIDEMVDQILQLPEGTRYQLLAPVVRGKKGTHVKLLSGLVAEGFARVRINGEVRELADNIELDKNHAHNIEVVVDRLVAREGVQERLTDSLRTALKRGEGLALVEVVPKADEPLPEGIERERLYSENFACPVHGAVMDELSPRLFSFNSPYGACPDCHGIGHLRQFTTERVIPDPTLPVYAAVAPWAEKDNAYYFSLLYSVGEAFGFEIKTPWNELTPEQHDALLNGSKQPIAIQADSRYRKAQTYLRPFEGILPILERQLRDASGESMRQKLEKYLELVPCASCHGLRLKPEALAVRVGPYRIHELTSSSVGESLRRIEELMGVGASEGAEPLLSPRQIQIGDLVLREIRMRLKFLLDVGLDYLSLDRPAMTLSGGEAQRIRLATQIGAGLTGVLYVLDEPSIGLHQRDNDRLLNTLTKLRDLGNTLIVVEHDEDTIRAADHIVDIGPGAGVHGGHIVAEGDLVRVELEPKGTRAKLLEVVEQGPSRVTPDCSEVGRCGGCDRQQVSIEGQRKAKQDAVSEALVRIGGLDGSSLRPTRWSDALSRAADALGRTTPEKIGVIGGARLTNEDAYAWAKLFKGVLRTDNVDAQLGDGLDAGAVLGLPRATIDEVCTPGGTVLLLGPDAKEELPVLFLRLRHAAENDRVSSGSPANRPERASSTIPASPITHVAHSTPSIDIVTVRSGPPIPHMRTS